MQRMMQLKKVCICTLALMLMSVSGYLSASTIEIAVINSASQKTVASKLFREYENKHPGVKINLTSFPDSEFKSELSGWLSATKAKFDLIFWQGGTRLFQYVNKGQIAPVSKAVNEEVIKRTFTAGSLGAVTLNDTVYAIPTSYYQWGIYYRKSIFVKAGLTPPDNWEDFILAGKKLKQNGITPIALGNSGKWPASAWFDYLNLRINGLQFHRELLQGKHSFTDPRVDAVFSHWKELVDNGFYVKHYDAVDWNESLPFIYHSHAAMVLIGNFVTGELSPALIDDFAFIPFPVISPEIPLYEDAPLDIVMLPNNAVVTAEIKALLNYMSSSSFQSEYNQALGLISPHLNASVPDDEFIRSGAALLSEATGMAQFFDRDTKPDFVGPALDVFADFLKNGDAKAAQAKLENLRKQYLVISQ